MGGCEKNTLLRRHAAWSWHALHSGQNPRKKSPLCQIMTLRLVAAVVNFTFNVQTKLPFIFARLLFYLLSYFELESQVAMAMVLLLTNTHYQAFFKGNALRISWLLA